MAQMKAAQRGIALVIVLWLVTLLTIIAGGLVYSVRTDTVMTANAVSLARARAAAEAGIQRALYEMLRMDNDPARTWKADGQAHAMQVGDAGIEVSILDESAFIDLNNAPEALLRGLFLSVAVPSTDADRLVDAILDWRDADDLTRANGAERDAYEAAGLEQVPANANFRRVDEVALVLGMTRDIYRRIEGALTVHTGQAGVNASIAPRQVLLAMPGAAPEEVDVYLAQRDALRAENLPVPAFPPAVPFSSGMEGGVAVYNLKAMARLPDDTRFVRQAVARVATRDSKHPFLFLDWKEGSL